MRERVCWSPHYAAGWHVRVLVLRHSNRKIWHSIVLSTVDGREIVRAQAVQALAAGLAPPTDMNPVLLKPNTDKCANVIIHGHLIANMDACGFHDYKSIALKAVLESHSGY